MVASYIIRYGSPRLAGIDMFGQRSDRSLRIEGRNCRRRRRTSRNRSSGWGNSRNRSSVTRTDRRTASRQVFSRRRLRNRCSYSRIIRLRQRWHYWERYWHLSDQTRNWSVRDCCCSWRRKRLGGNCTNYGGSSSCRHGGSNWVKGGRWRGCSRTSRTWNCSGY